MEETGVFALAFRDILLFIVVPTVVYIIRVVVSLDKRTAIIEAERAKEKEAADERRKGYNKRNEELDKKLGEIDAHVKALPQNIVNLLKEVRKL